MKTRYSKPFESVQVKIPYTTGMDPYSGLVDMFEKIGLIEKSGNRLKYVTLVGEEFLEYRKKWTGELLDKVMTDFVKRQNTPPKNNEVVDVQTAEDEIGD